MPATNVQMLHDDGHWDVALLLGQHRTQVAGGPWWATGSSRSPSKVPPSAWLGGAAQ